MITNCTKCNKQLLTEADPYLIVPVDNYAIVCYDCVVKDLKDELTLKKNAIKNHERILGFYLDKVNKLQQCDNCKYDWVVDQEGSVRNKDLYLNKCNICGDREMLELKE